MPRCDDVKSFAKASTPAILYKAQEVVGKEVARTTIFESSIEEIIPRFHANEMVSGRVVGRGGFCVVRELNEIKLRWDSEGNISGSEKEGTTLGRWNPRLLKRGASSGTSGHSSRTIGNGSVDGDYTREYVARRVWSKKGGKFVIKQVEETLLVTDKVTFLIGIIDLALEAKFLASLNHPHILKLRGTSYEGPFETPGYFLVLDHLHETLSKRLNSWLHLKRATQGITGFVTGSKRKVTALLTDRLLVAYDVAEAMDYLHAKGIIYRDLKPDNIGFNVNGLTKLFDFGLAKELIPEEKGEDGLYRMTALTGGIRYMAPEVGLGFPYNLKADVYSWSMLMWYILALEPPMGMYTTNMFIDRVFQKGYRPAIKEKWSPRLSELMRTCWSEDMHERPTFREIMIELRREVRAVDPHVASIMEVAIDN